MPILHLRVHLDAITERLHNTRSLDLASDFDGTLSPIVEYPSSAAIDPGALAALRRIARTRHARVAVVSGRPLVQVRKLVPLRGIALAGNSGIEISRAIPVPRTRRTAVLPAGLFEVLVAWAAQFPLAWVEQKGIVLAAHFGRLPHADRVRFLAGLKRRLAPHAARVQVTNGARSVDLAPRGSDDKGTVVRRWHEAGPKRALLIYLGDDANDLPALAYARRCGGIAIAVGRPLAGAHYLLADPHEAAAFLAWLAQVWSALAG